MTLTLTRWGSHPEFGTFGQILVRGLILYTVEQPWRDNEVGRSCIPPGTYRVRRGWYNRGGYEAWEIEDVVGRSEIKIHKANLAGELRGCIAPGMQMGTLRGIPAVVRSGEALAWWLAMPESIFNLTISTTWT